MIPSILIIYIISIFISRQWNKILYKYNSKFVPVWQSWFIPFFNIFILITITIILIFEDLHINNTFTGKNWKSKN